MLTFLKGFFGNAIIPAFKEVEEALSKDIVNIPEQLKILETKPIVAEVIEKIEMPDIDPELKQVVEEQIGNFSKLQETKINSYNSDTKIINEVLSIMSKKNDITVINKLIQDDILDYDEETKLYTIKYTKTDSISTDTWNKLFDAKVLKTATIKDTFELSPNTMHKSYTNYQNSMNKYYNLYDSAKLEEKELLGNILVTLNKNRSFFGEKGEGRPIIQEATKLTDYRIPKLESLKTHFYQTYQNMLTAESILKSQSPVLKQFIEASKKQIVSVKKITDITKQLNVVNETLSKDIKALQGTQSDLNKTIIELKKSGETQTGELTKATANLKTVTTQLDKTKLDLTANKNLLNEMEKTKLSNENKLQELQQSILSSETKLSQTTEELEKTKLSNEIKLQELQQSIKVSEQKLIDKAEELQQKTVQSQATEQLLQQEMLKGEDLLLKNKNIADTLESYKNDFLKLEGDKQAIEVQLFNAQKVIETKTTAIEVTEKEIEALETNLKLKIEEQDSVKGKITNFLEGTKEFIISQKILTGASVSSIVVAIGSVIALIVKEVTQHPDTKEAVVKRVYNKTGISKDLLAKLYDKALGIKEKAKPKKINKVKPKKKNIKKK